MSCNINSGVSRKGRKVCNSFKCFKIGVLHHIRSWLTFNIIIYNNNNIHLIIIIFKLAQSKKVITTRIAVAHHFICRLRRRESCILGAIVQSANITPTRTTSG